VKKNKTSKGGRPPKYKGERLSKNRTFRVRGLLDEQLIAAAAESGRSVSEEIEYRLERSFQAGRQAVELESLKARLTRVETQLEYSTFADSTFAEARDELERHEKYRQRAAKYRAMARTSPEDRQQWEQMAEAYEQLAHSLQRRLDAEEHQRRLKQP